MDEAWKILVDAGVPDGAPRRLSELRLHDVELRDALRIAMAGYASLGPRQQETLSAWVCGFRSHWPSRFANILGAEGESAYAQLEAALLDEGRHVKLRRIAIENLAAIV